jgi:ATP:ADP antiporter, AAA family
MSKSTAYGRDATDRVVIAPAPSPASPRSSIPERLLGLFATVRPGEGPSAALFFVYAFLLLISYYVLKTIREPLLLATGSAALKSYAYAAIAAVLLLMVPLYGVLFRRTGKRQLVRWITIFFASNLVLFYVLGRVGADVGFAYYVWVGVFGVMMLTQFWAHAAHTYKVESGQRLFPMIMAGAACGGLAGPRLSGALFEALGAWNLMLIAIAVLLATIPLVEGTWLSVPECSRNGTNKAEAAAFHGPSRVLGGFTLVLRDRNLLLLALLAVLLNCVGTTGEYILTELVIRDAERQMAAQPGLDKAALIAQFYGDYYFVVNALGLVLQLFLVARVFRWIGVQGALLVLPLIALVGYGLVLFAPVFTIIRAVKVLENSTNYTLMNTARQALYLPLPPAHQFEGKTAVDTFFWRFGDVLQAGLIYVGLNWLGFGFEQFALVNIVLAIAWIAVVLRIGARYPREAARRFKLNWRALAVGASSAAFAVAVFALPRNARAETPALFSDHEPLAIELRMDSRELCRGTRRRTCSDVPATLVYTRADGGEQTIETSIRARGKWRNETGHCSVPPLFVSFRGDTDGTPFEGQSMLPLTTHCRAKPADYEQYVLKEYLAYRIYNVLADKSLRVRLARIRYRDARRGRSVERYAFFTEHFESLAARHGAELRQAEQFDSAEADPRELATFELFQYLIGNTDWSIVAGHNVTYLRSADGIVTAIPYDFDFAGVVDAAYAGPPPQLPIRTVTERLFRGFCRPDTDWPRLFAAFREQRGTIGALVEQIRGLEPAQRDDVREFLDAFFDILDSKEQRQERVVEACRPGAAP